MQGKTKSVCDDFIKKLNTELDETREHIKNLFNLTESEFWQKIDKRIVVIPDAGFFEMQRNKLRATIGKKGKKKDIDNVIKFFINLLSVKAVLLEPERRIFCDTYNAIEILGLDYGYEKSDIAELILIATKNEVYTLTTISDEEIKSRNGNVDKELLHGVKEVINKNCSLKASLNFASFGCFLRKKDLSIELILILIDRLFQCNIKSYEKTPLYKTLNLALNKVVINVVNALFVLKTEMDEKLKNALTRKTEKIYINNRNDFQFKAIFDVMSEGVENYENIKKSKKKLMTFAALCCHCEYLFECLEKEIANGVLLPEKLSILIEKSLRLNIEEIAKVITLAIKENKKAITEESKKANEVIAYKSIFEFVKYVKPDGTFKANLSEGIINRVCIELNIMKYEGIFKMLAKKATEEHEKMLKERESNLTEKKVLPPIISNPLTPSKLGNRSERKVLYNIQKLLEKDGSIFYECSESIKAQLALASEEITRNPEERERAITQFEGFELALLICQVLYYKDLLCNPESEEKRKLYIEQLVDCLRIYKLHYANQELDGDENVLRMNKKSE